MKTVGVLALQGAFAKHISMLGTLNVQAIEVRKKEELDSCDALIIPGGESTTMLKQMQVWGLIEPIRLFASKKPLFGTCAGMILMAREEVGNTLSPFGFIDMAVERNGYGRQSESFKAEISLPFQKGFPATFIRAPIIRCVSPDVRILATHNELPILVQQGRHLSASFHPELSDNPAIHRYFLSQ